MRREIHERKCDQCKKVAEHDALNPLIGGMGPFYGWLHVERANSGMYTSGEDNGPWDFCAVECLSKYFKKSKKRT